MEYIIKVCGEVVDSQYKAYAVTAKNEEEAKKKAKQCFQDEFYTNGNVVIVEKPLPRKKKSIFALIAMTIPILLSLIDWKYKHDTFSISPDLISCLFGAILYSSFVIRFKGIQRAVESKYDILFTIISTLLLSTFVKVLLFENHIKVFGIFDIPVNTNIILIAAVILSWLGLKIVSLSCIGIVVILALGNIVGLNNAMGTIWGSLYIISSFLGIVMYSSVEPAFLETKNALSRFAKRNINYLNNDLTEAKEHASKIKDTIENKINSDK